LTHKRGKRSWFYSLSLWERAGVRAAAFARKSVYLPPLALTPTLSQREREQDPEERE
jgi:hypothetical protein